MVSAMRHSDPFGGPATIWALAMGVYSGDPENKWQEWAGHIQWVKTQLDTWLEARGLSWDSEPEALELALEKAGEGKALGGGLRKGLAGKDAEHKAKPRRSRRARGESAAG